MHPMKTSLRQIILTLFVCTIQVFATTWDEPWHKEVVQDADSYIRVMLTQALPNRVEFILVKHLAGFPVEKEGALTGFSKLNFGSYSVKEDVFRLNPKMEYYLFVKRTKRRHEYEIATPSTGYAEVDGKMGSATYRHSYHQALVPIEDYEMTMTAIFKELKHESQNLDPARKYVASQLALKPAGIPTDTHGDEFSRFCGQHVALELQYYLGGADIAKLEPFLRHENPHGQISAVRALGRLPKTVAMARLIDFIASPDRDGFAKVMAIWALRDMHAVEAGPKLRETLSSTRDEKTGFGGNIMDPRVATQFPESVHASIQEVLELWEKESQTK